MTWIRFDFKGKTAVPKITIAKNGVFGFNYAAQEKYSLDKYEFVVFYINKEESKIGIKMFESEGEKEIGSRKLRKVEKGKGVFISGHSFLEYNHLSFLKGKKFEFEFDQNGQKVVFDYQKKEPANT